MTSELLTSTFTRFREQLRRLAAGIAGAAEAEDILHDAFCRLWAHHPAVKSEKEALRLSYTSVRNAAIDTYRSAAAHPSQGLGPEADAAASEAGGNDDGRDEREETLRAVLAIARRRLPPGQFRVFELHDLQGTSYAETAEELCTTIENVRTTLSRARKSIREVYNSSKSQMK